MKNLRTLLILSKLTLIANLRNFSAIFFGFLFPLIFIMVFGLVGQGGAIVEVGVLSGSDNSNAVYETLTKIEAIKLITDRSDETLNDQLKKGQIDALIKFETTEFAPGLKSIETKLQTSSAAPQGGSTVTAILENVNSKINEAGTPLTAPKISNLEVTNVEGRKYKQIDFILPGQLNFALLSTGVFGIAFSLITLRQTLVLKRMYATPTPKWIILGARVISSLIVALLQASFIIGVGHFAFGFTLINGVWTYLSMLALAMVGLLVFLGLGLIVTSLASSEDAAAPLANMITMPQFLLSGTFFPIEAFPGFLQALAKVMPMTYLNEAMRIVAFEGGNLDAIWTHLVALLIIGIVVYAVVLKIFKWQ
jgi:ABC-2 type transport system permease protein